MNHARTWKHDFSWNDMDSKYFRMHGTFETCRCILYTRTLKIVEFECTINFLTHRRNCEERFFFSFQTQKLSYKLFYFHKNLYLNQFLKNLLIYANSIFIPLSFSSYFAYNFETKLSTTFTLFVNKI